jgi:hypothetical protein
MQVISEMYEWTKTRLERIEEAAADVNAVANSVNQ